MCCCICNEYTDCSKTNDTKFLSGNLSSCKILFLLFCSLCNVLIILVCKTPVDATYDVTGCIKHSSKNQFFNTVCICTWCVEYNNTFVCTFIKWNIVYTCASAGNSQ